VLTQLETKILNTIEQHISTHNIAPTIGEIASSLDISSRGTVHRYVQSLIKKGVLERLGTGWRGLRLVSPSPFCAAGREVNPTPTPASGLSTPQIKNLNTSNLSPIQAPFTADSANNSEQFKIPLLGTIAAGVPIEAIPDQQHLDLSVFLVGPDRYALRVTGESMIDAGILDGDTVILRKTSVARTGDIVVALIDNQEATLKRLGKTEDGLTELIPENSGIPTMLYSSKRISIQGVLVGQLRSY